MMKNEMVKFIIENTKYTAEYLESLSIITLKEIVRVLKTDTSDTWEEGL